MTSPKTLRVAFDATATPHNLVGAGYYVKEVVSRLDHGDDIDLTIITRKDDMERFGSFAPRSRVLGVAPRHTPARIAYQFASLGSFVDGLDVDVFHGPHYQLPRSVNTPSVVTIHDTTLLTHSHVHTRAKSLFFSRMIPYSAGRARSVIAVSQHTADDIESLIEHHGEIFVAPLGIDRERFFAADLSDSDQALLKERGIATPYIAFLGLLEPRKSVPTLVKAFAQIADKFPDHRLILAGGHGWGTDDVRAAVRESGVTTRIVLPGRLSTDEVGPYLRGAEIFVYPSVYEGFGMPVAEAMACGTATITTDSSSLREVAGKGALLFTPGNDQQLAEMMASLLSGSTLRAQMEKKALTRSKDFSWDECVHRHIAAYQYAAG